MRGPTAASLCSPYRGTLKHMPSLYCSLRIAGISKREEELVPNIDYSTSNFAALSQYFFVALKALLYIRNRWKGISVVLEKKLCLNFTTFNKSKNLLHC